MQCILEISLKKIKSNWEKINKYSDFKASAVVKANAYGFGLEEIAIALNQSGCNFFYVAQIEEGIKLRNRLKSDKIKIGVLEGMIHHPEEYKKNNLIPVINNLNQLNNFINYKKLGKDSLQTISKTEPFNIISMLFFISSVVSLYYKDRGGQSPFDFKISNALKVFSTPSFTVIDG